jgi:hypothetical protein
VDELFTSYPELNVTKNEVVLVEDASYLRNFSEIYLNIMADEQKQK